MTLAMTPGQLERSRATRRRRAAENVERRRARAEAACSSARRAAGVLRSDSGATEVCLFGSPAETGAFGSFSAIDLAVRGLGSAHHAAVGRLLSLSRDFEFDLVDLDACSQGLRDEIVGRGVRL